MSRINKTNSFIFNFESNTITFENKTTIYGFFTFKLKDCCTRTDLR